RVGALRSRGRRAALGRAPRSLLRADLVSGGGAVTRATAPRFPALTRAFSAYLHEDFAAEYGSPEAALRALRDEASRAEWRRVPGEAQGLAAIARDGDFDDVRALMQRLGSRWLPPSRDALVALLTRVSKAGGSTGR